MKKKFIVYNPYEKRQLLKLLLNYKLLNGSFAKRFLVKRFLNNFIYTIICLLTNKFKSVLYLSSSRKLFRIIEIETINRCNNNCAFCPVNKLNEPRVFYEMSMDLFKKVIDDLASLKYSGIIFFHSNNEPLLDNQLECKIKYAREKCNKAFLSFYTNGILLNAEILLRFRNAGIDKVIVNNYNNSLHLNKNISKLLEFLKSIDAKKYPSLAIILRKKDEVLNNRAGAAPNKNTSLSSEFKLFRQSSCYLPFEEIIIRADGKVSLCSNDALGKITMGDINTESLENIWFGEKYRAIRTQLIHKKRFQIDLCSICDK